MKRNILLIIVGVLVGSTTASAQGVMEELFHWQGRLAEDQWIEVKGVTGSISARPADGDMVEVIARGSQLPEAAVRFEVVEHLGGVTICAMYPIDDNDCQPGDEGRLRANRGKSVRVEFTVQVPPGVVFAGRTVNGSVTASDLSGDVEARTVNGSIDLSTAGHARAETVNGRIRAAIGSAEWQGEAAFKTVNGSVTVAVPDSIDAEVYLQTVNGSISTELPIAMTGQLTKRRRLVEGTLGHGGPELRMTTTNGSVRLRRRTAESAAQHSINDGAPAGVASIIIQRIVHRIQRIR